MKVLRSGKSLKQCKQRLCQARAKAIRSGKPHHKLDEKIEYINSQLSMMSTLINVNSRPSPSRYSSHARPTRTVQGGKVSPK